MDIAEVFVGLVIVVAADGKVDVVYTVREVPLEQCMAEVKEKVAAVKDAYESVSGFCRQLPPKPAAAKGGNAVSTWPLIKARESAEQLKLLCHTASASAGWWVDRNGQDIRGNPYCFSTKLMLAVSELSEAMEGDREGAMDDHLPHRRMAEVELADALIRIFDLAGAYNFDIGGALVEKLEYNRQRADHTAEARAAAGGKAY